MESETLREYFKFGSEEFSYALEELEPNLEFPLWSFEEPRTVSSERRRGRAVPYRERSSESVLPSPSSTSLEEEEEDEEEVPR